jgi:transcriptional regulator with XRE-family HTH domain
MSDRDPDVASRLLEIRQGRGLSLRALADVSGLSVNAISRIERGESSPTVTSLQRLASALDVPLMEFFMVDPPHATVIVRAGERLRTRTDGVLIESLGTGLPGQQLGPFLMTLEPGASGGEEPIAHGGEEFVHCLEGEAEYLVDDGWHALAEGDSLLFLAHQRHMCRNAGTARARLLIVILAPEEEIQTTQQRHLMVEEAQVANVAAVDGG